jgi:chromosome segregation ATPase
MEVVVTQDLSKIQKSVNLLLRERELYERYIEDLKDKNTDQENTIEQLEEKIIYLEDTMQETLEIIKRQQDELEKRSLELKAEREARAIELKAERETREENNKVLIEALLLSMEVLKALRRDYNYLHDTTDSHIKNNKKHK